ncbi:MIP family Ig-specific serine endopeptidase [Ureaplasma diversum]|uniref:DUF31 domain-containing protein n=1 Tax=Ureaplasma diversum NCTC 246 TaxID=1188241 RepID=A0A084EXY1_9BACT|nr:hypothetical protein [Ureaplasma diversum]KEZ22823.1 Hypothetical protein, predicted lipoprotein, DUF31 family [Ureaplasma diversum NCTC 246]
MNNKKKIFLMSSVSFVAATSIIAVAAACTEEQKPEQKPNQPSQKQSDTKSGSGSSVIRNNSSKNSIKFTVTLQSDTLGYNNQKHNLRLNVGSQYARKVVEVELKPNSSSSSRSSIKSTKVASNTKGDTKVEFSGLEHNKSYYVSAVNIYDDLRKTTPIVSNSYSANTSETLVVKTPANSDGSNSVGSSNGSSNPNNGFDPGQGQNQPFDPNANLGALLEHIKKQNELRQKLANRRPASKEVKELKIKDDEAYQKIKNRSFAIGFNSVDYAIEKENFNKVNDSIVPFNPTGTGWLLDYAWKNNQKDSDELMLYIATNAHVYSRAFNAMKDSEPYKKQFPEYFTQEAQKQAKIDSFILAVPKKEASLEAIPSGQSYDSKNDLEYFVNRKNEAALFSSDNQGKQITYDEDKVFENPKTVFVALNIFDKENNEKLIDKANNNAQRKYSGKDFAVFGLKVNYKKLKDKANSNDKYKLLLEHIQAAMKSVDADITKFSSKKYPNHDKGSIPYLSIDHPSVWIDEQKSEEQKLDKNTYNLDENTTSLNVERAYIAGFPTIGRKQMLWRNYPKNSNIPQDAFTGTSFTIGQPLKTVLDANSEASGFGFNAFVDYSSIYFGASGSLVVDEYGLPIGIYSSISSVNSETDVSKKGGFTYLVQVHNDNEKGPAHNLIDGTDNKKFPNQQKSYRQNLRWLSQQSDSEFKDFAKTAIFKEGA